MNALLRCSLLAGLAPLVAGCQLAGPRTNGVGPASAPFEGARMRTVGEFREIVQSDGVVVSVPESAARAIEWAAGKRDASNTKPPESSEPLKPDADKTAPAAPAKPDAPAVPAPAQREGERKATEGTAQDRKVAKYLLKVGDRLEIVYSLAAGDDQEYRLQAGDEIRVEFLHLGLGEVGAQGEGRSPASTLDRNLRLQPDGKISLPYIGLVQAAGRNASALADVLNERYRKFYVEPKMHVTLLSTGSGLRDLRDGLQAAGSRLVEIAPDGRIGLPYLGSVMAADLTVAELQSELSERHKKQRPGTLATVRLIRGSER